MLDKWTSLGLAASVLTHIGILRMTPHSPVSSSFEKTTEVELWEAEVIDPMKPLPEERRLEEPLREEDEPAPPMARQETALAPAPSAPAEAGVTLTATAADEAAVDFTLVQGTGEMYAGGVTSTRGRSKKVGRSKPGVEGGRGHSERRGSGRGRTIDRSRGASPAGGSWSCSHLFPAAADESEVHQAVVRVIVSVGADGRAGTIRVLNDPGYGFAAAAQSCAASQRYQPALDERGRPIAAATAPFSIRFTR